MIPEWIGDGEDFRDFIFNAHAKSVNASSVGLGGHSIHVAIFDSVYSPPGDIGDNVDIRHNRRFVDTSEDYATLHGFRVGQLAADLAPNVTMSFYQIVTDSRDIPVSAFADAIDAAIQDGVDIVNISSGEPWRGPVSANPHSVAVKRLLEEGITVVAAAGNDTGLENKKPVHCPAAVEDVIAVGGVVSKCPASFDQEFSEFNTGPYFELSNSVKKPLSGAPKHLYCGQTGCVDGESCIENQTEVPWEGNPSETGNKPDVYAPVHYPYVMKNGQFKITCGTSFAAPIVTGALAEAYSELKHEGHQLPTPYQATRGIRKTATCVGPDQIRKLNQFKLKEHLKQLSVSKESVV